MDKAKLMNGVKKYTMIIVLVLVTLFFTWQTGGKILLPQNVSNLISQNAYVFVLATGMLLCILTGGNIDLSVGSVVCFAGAVGATLMESKGMNPWAASIMMLLIGLLIGAWQAFWIAYVHVPPFITTLSGMLVFRGLSNVVLNGLTVSLTNAGFVKVFGGGAECYIPDFFGGNGFNITCMLVGVIACVIYVLVQIKNRMNRAKKGYETTINIMAVSKARTEDITAALETLGKTPVNAFYIVDSYGALYPEESRRLADLYCSIADKYGKSVGIHAHNNQQLAFANTIEAMTQGVSYLDATVDGMGRGAGNCALELLLGFLKNPKYQVAPILKIIEEYTHKFKAEGVKWGYDIPYLLTGQYNTHPRPAIQFVKEDRQDYYKFSNELYDIINS